jgi:hypothetical protein
VDVNVLNNVNIECLVIVSAPQYSKKDTQVRRIFYVSDIEEFYINE